MAKLWFESDQLSTIDGGDVLNLRLLAVSSCWCIECRALGMQNLRRMRAAYQFAVHPLTQSFLCIFFTG